jgi:hypothetical protein
VLKAYWTTPFQSAQSQSDSATLAQP